MHRSNTEITNSNCHSRK